MFIHLFTNPNSSRLKNPSIILVSSLQKKASYGGYFGKLQRLEPPYSCFTMIVVPPQKCVSPACTAAIAKTATPILIIICDGQ